MSTRTDWEAAAEDFMAAERGRLGGPPTPEEVVAYARGELSEADASRVRSLLVCYPELTSVLTEPPPRFAARRRITSTRLFALAASVLLIISAGLGIQLRRQSQELNTPHVMSVHDLTPSLLTRGPRQPPNRLVADEKNSVLVFNYLPEAPRYRIELLEGAQSLWTARVANKNGEPIQLSLRRGLAPGNYRVDVYGADDSTPLATYELRVSEPPQE
ncbi:MAG TPA: hypothetical protein VGR02_00420 [Thermoanaerobaculia bacterium]|nr:hypothetical protein [Thermoanaerobaculia bacterium]